MYTEEEIKAINEQIAKNEKDIKALEANISSLEQNLLQDAIECANARFPWLEEGMLVDVTVESRDIFSDTKKQFVSRLYFAGFGYPVYHYTIRKDDVRFDFNQVKKDGTMSKRTDYYYNRSIIDIKKVTK